jgi:hypothetical protein
MISLCGQHDHLLVATYLSTATSCTSQLCHTSAGLFASQGQVQQSATIDPTLTPPLSISLCDRTPRSCEGRHPSRASAHQTLRPPDGATRRHAPHTHTHARTRTRPRTRRQWGRGEQDRRRILTQLVSSALVCQSSPSTCTCRGYVQGSGCMPENFRALKRKHQKRRCSMRGSRRAGVG